MNACALQSLLPRIHKQMQNKSETKKRVYFVEKHHDNCLLDSFLHTNHPICFLELQDHIDNVLYSAISCNMICIRYLEDPLHRKT